MHSDWIRKPNKGAATTSVVFVHGILSSGEKCWRHPEGAYWPELLKSEPELEALGIYVYTYQTGFTSGSYSLSNIVDDLKERVFNMDSITDSHKIVFVCHSMGGIIVRKLIVERIIDFLDRNIEVGLYLVASPSLGSKYANWLEPIARAAGHAQAQALRFSQDNQWLNDLDKTFMNLKESKRLTLRGKELLEDKFITLPSFLHKQVVEWYSGARYFGESFKVAGSDHFSIAKPEGKGADQHRLLVVFLKNFMVENDKTSSEQKTRGANAPIESNEELSAKDFLKSQLEHLKDFLVDPLEPEDHDKKIHNVSELRERLKKLDKLQEPQLIRVRGTLFPAALLNSGWWEKNVVERQGYTSGLKWKTDLQEWLYEGFKEWAPSWDVSWSFDGREQNAKSYYIAQLAAVDEAESLAVIIQGKLAVEWRENFSKSWGGCEVEITGVLGHRSQARNELAAGAAIEGKAEDYCIWLKDDDVQYKIEETTDTQIYSGYLWQCLIPERWLEDKDSIRLDDVYLVWEHTNFAKKSALEYNRASLEQKKAYIKALHPADGKLLLLQQSHGRYFPDTEPIWPVSDFFKLLFEIKKVKIPGVKLCQNK